MSRVWEVEEKQGSTRMPPRPGGAASTGQDEHGALGEGERPVHHRPLDGSDDEPIASQPFSREPLTIISKKPFFTSCEKHGLPCAVKSHKCSAGRAKSRSTYK